MLVVYAGVIVFGLNEFRKTPIGFIPQLDRGYLIIITQLPPAASLARTDDVNRRAVDIALKIPGIAHAVNIVGFSGATFTNAPNAGAVFVTLSPFEERAKDPRQTAAAIQGQLFMRLQAIKDGLIFVAAPPPVAGIGNAGGFRMMVEDRAGRGSQALQGAVYAMMGRAAQTPGLVQVFSLFENTTPQLYLDIDRVKAQLLGINIPDVFAALQIYLGSAYVNDFNLFGRTYRVVAQADSDYRKSTEDVLRIRVRNNSGNTVPLGAFTTVRTVTGPYRVPRYNLYPAAELDGAAAPGFSQGQAIKIMEQLAAQTLPEGFSYEWTTLAFQQLRAGNTAMFAFVLAVVFVFLVLAAQFESLTLPLAVILIVPMCLIASIVGVVIRGQDNNILTQVGFIVLIGLAAKNAILIVEFAKQLEDAGRDRFAAAVEAAHLRLRPILMTSMAFILGVTPLVWAIGAGAELRQTLGTAVFSGMIGVTLFGLIFTPVFYVVTRWIALRFARRAAAIRGGEAMTMKFGFGQPLTRKEDDALLRGAGRYVADVAPAATLHAVVLRSPHAHARFSLEDLDRVRTMPGVRLVLTGAEVADLGPLPTPGVLPDVDIKIPVYPILAKDVVRHVGDAVAFVVADSLAAAKDAAEAIAVDWQPLPHVIGAVAALAPGAPRVWADRPSNLAFETELGDAAATKAAFARAARTVELTIVNQRLVTNYMDTRGVIAEYDGKRYTLTLGSQGSHVIRDIICGQVLKLPLDRMRVITPDVGGGFGTKLFPYREYALAAVAAERTGKPVKWVCERSEHFLGDSHGRDNISTARLALDDKGRFLALDLDIVADMGAYLSCYAPYIPWLGAGMATGAYDIPAAHVRLRAAYTNTVPVDAYRGAGPAGGVLSDRAAGRRRGARTRHRPRYVAPAQFDQAEGDALYDADRQDLRLGRFRRDAGARARDCRLERLQQACRGVQTSRQAARHRRCHLCRGLRRQRAGNGEH